jgi:pimeloyl-ACP methyl ester carboxylesterase
VREYDLDALAGDVIGIIQSTGRSKVHLVGHDWGAAVAWHTAIQYPEMIDKLVILNVPHPDIMQQTLMGSFSQLRKSWYMFYFQIPWLPETSISRRNFAGGVSALRHSGKPTTFSKADIAAYREAWSQPGAMTGMINWYRAVFRRSLRSGLNTERSQPRPVPVPTLVLWGKDDIALNLEMAQPSLELCAGGKLVVFDDASHWVQCDCAAQVNQEMLAFLRGG